MNLDEISEKYQQNLIKFFDDDKVMEYIYTEQYGYDDYVSHKDEYTKQYRKILENTVFIPYITLEDLDNFIDTTKKNKGEKFVNENLIEEIRLSKRLHAKKEEIIQKYNNYLVEDLKTIIPEFASKKQIFSNTNFEKNLRAVIEYVNAQKQGIKANFIKKKVNKILIKYADLVREKILMETSTYYKHMRDRKNEKYSPNLMDNIKRNRTATEHLIGKKSEKNCRYIYLPIFKYTNKKEYLTVAIHEVMHISKEKIYKDKYQSGLSILKMSDNQMSGDTYSRNVYMENLIQHLRWRNFREKIRRKISTPKKNNIMRRKLSLKNILNVISEAKRNIETPVYIGEIELEESMHHWQVRKVVDRVTKDGLDAQLYTPYNKGAERGIPSSYERTDSITKKIMEDFKEDIQQINSGELSVENLKNKVGRSEYELLGNLYRVWNRR